MALPKPKPWATDLKTYWSMNVPTAVNGTVPGWSAMVNQVIAGYNAGKAITYRAADDNQLFYLMQVTSAELRFFGRFAPNQPSAGNCTLFFISINRSTGAVTKKQIRLSQTGYV